MKDRSDNTRMCRSWTLDVAELPDDEGRLREIAEPAGLALLQAVCEDAEAVVVDLDGTLMHGFAALDVLSQEWRDVARAFGNTRRGTARPARGRAVANLFAAVTRMLVPLSRCGVSAMALGLRRIYSPAEQPADHQHLLDRYQRHVLLLEMTLPGAVLDRRVADLFSTWQDRKLRKEVLNALRAARKPVFLATATSRTIAEGVAAAAGIPRHRVIASEVDRVRAAVDRPLIGGNKIDAIKSALAAQGIDPTRIVVVADVDWTGADEAMLSIGATSVRVSRVSEVLITSLAALLKGASLGSTFAFFTQLMLSHGLQSSVAVVALGVELGVTDPQTWFKMVLLGLTVGAIYGVTVWHWGSVRNLASAYECLTRWGDAPPPEVVVSSYVPLPWRSWARAVILQEGTHMTIRSPAWGFVGWCAFAAVSCGLMSVRLPGVWLLGCVAIGLLMVGLAFVEIGAYPTVGAKLFGVPRPEGSAFRWKLSDGLHRVVTPAVISGLLTACWLSVAFCHASGENVSLFGHVTDFSVLERHSAAFHVGIFMAQLLGHTIATNGLPAPGRRFVAATMGGALWVLLWPFGGSNRRWASWFGNADQLLDIGHNRRWFFEPQTTTLLAAGGVSVPEGLQSAFFLYYEVLQGAREHAAADVRQLNAILSGVLERTYDGLAKLGAEAVVDLLPRIVRRVQLESAEVLRGVAVRSVPVSRVLVALDHEVRTWPSKGFSEQVRLDLRPRHNVEDHVVDVCPPEAVVKVLAGIIENAVAAWTDAGGTGSLEVTVEVTVCAIGHAEVRSAATPGTVAALAERSYVRFAVRNPPGIAFPLRANIELLRARDGGQVAGGSLPFRLRMAGQRVRGLGLGLPFAAVLAMRWNGALELTEEDGSPVVALLLPLPIGEQAEKKFTKGGPGRDVA